MKKKLSITMSALLIAGLALANNPDNGKTVYVVDTKESKVLWVGKKVTGQHSGTLSLSEGSVSVSGTKLSAIDVTMDMTSIIVTDLEDEAYNQKLLGHLKSDDFFSVEKHTKASFKATGIKPIAGAKGEEDNYTVTGNLTIKGITNEISFPARVEMKNKKLAAVGKASFDRTKWEIRYGSGSFFEGLGDKMIYDDIEITFALIATLKQVN